ncbi:hypothetical protein GGR51DRAFT_559188 [Nemania sp. FL0031]|nr:hypothetical protein GGR51DRAFT_559188 [Nemania sp. FL0031]
MGNTFYDMSPEMIGMILKCIDDIDSLVATFSVHPCFLKTFELYSGIAEGIIQQQVHPHLLPLAVAVIDGLHGRYRSTAEVTELCRNLYQEPNPFTNRLKARRSDENFNVGNALSTRDLVQIGRCHNFIGELVDKYAAMAWKITGPDDAVNLSETETEREQMMCAHRFLRAWFTYKGYNNLEVDEASPNADVRVKIWISQGFILLMQLEKAENVEAKKRLLARACKAKYVLYDDEMRKSYGYHHLTEPWLDIENNIIGYRQPEHGPYCDTDLGPLYIWIRANVYTGPRDCWVNIVHPTDFLGPGAYVFWDEKRVYGAANGLFFCTLAERFKAHLNNHMRRTYRRRF